MAVLAEYEVYSSKEGEGWLGGEGTEWHSRVAGLFPESLTVSKAHALGPTGLWNGG